MALQFKVKVCLFIYICPFVILIPILSLEYETLTYKSMISIF